MSTLSVLDAQPGLRWHRRFTLISMGVILTAFSYPLFFMFTQGRWKTPRHDYSSPYPLLTFHASLGLLAMSMFFVQYLTTSRWRLGTARKRTFHRWWGRTFLFVVSPLFAASAFYLATHSEINFDTDSRIMIITAVGWFLIYALLGFRSVRRQEFDQHADYMVMSFVLITIAAMVRLVLYTDALLQLHMKSYEYKPLTIVLIVGQLFAFAHLRGIVPRVRLLLWLTTISFFVPLLYFEL